MRISRIVFVTFALCSLVAMGCGKSSLPTTAVVQENSVSQLPTWVQNLGLTLPQGMQFMASLSKQTHVDDSGYDSLFLVYQGSYDQALQEAAHIASGAHLTASQEVINAQKLVNQGKQFSGLDTSSLSKGIVYTNYALTAMNIDYLVVVSVDGNGVLTIEATNYQQMKNRK